VDSNHEVFSSAPTRGIMIADAFEPNEGTSFISSTRRATTRSAAW